jgi:hypothetical protein
MSTTSFISSTTTSSLLSPIPNPSQGDLPSSHLRWKEGDEEKDETKEEEFGREISFPIGINSTSASASSAFPSPSSVTALPQSKHQRQQRKEGLKVLMCGWRRDVKDMLSLMEHTLPHGSSVHLLSEKPHTLVENYMKDHCSSFDHLTVTHSFGRADVRRRLVESNSLCFGDPTREDVDVVLVVADESKERDVLLSDSQTIASCLLVRDVQADEIERRDISLADLSIPQLEALHVSCPMLAEILDVATRATIEENPAIKAVADFFVVNDLAARLIAAVADRREVASVLGELLGPDQKSQDMFVVESSSLLYEDEVVASRHAACIDVGNVVPRYQEELGMLAYQASFTDEKVHNTNVGKANLALVAELKKKNSASFKSSSSEADLLAEKAKRRFPFLSNITNSSNSYSYNNDSSSSSSNSFQKERMARPVSFAELASRAAAAPRHGILLGYIKATWNPKTNLPGELATVFNPQCKGAPLYWHAKDFLIIMSIEDYRSPHSRRKFTVVR